MKATGSATGRRQSSDDLDMDWESPRSSFEESPCLPRMPTRRKLCRMDACEDAAANSVRSRYAEPPSPESLRRREELYMQTAECRHAETQAFLFPRLQRGSLCKTLAPPFLMRSRPKAIRINGRVLSISLQGDTLLSQLAVVGGNKTGVFVHQVTEGTAAHTVGISPGAQIVEVDYEALLQPLQSGEMSSGDSFYIRVNMSLPAGPNGALAVSCNDILHVTNTRPTGTEDSWRASLVHPCQLLDLQSGNVPHYYRSAGRLVAQSKQKAVRIVGTMRQGRNPLRYICTQKLSDPHALQPGHPPLPPVCRPVLLLPSILGHILDKKLADWQGFQLCEPEVLSSSEHAARLQRSEILEECEQGTNCCYTTAERGESHEEGDSLRAAALGLDCVRRLRRAEIFPIIIFIGQTARSARQTELQRHNQSEESLLACSRSEEPLLDKLPCLYHSVAPDSWCDQASLLSSLRTVIWEEQKKIVWVEPDLW
ncbi:hypothetical protein F7725_005262 [Dissostichus mawsoni]|uniref:Caspase recruitment domain-containing protein 14 n=1 Tax=Dissostichus mawsoni TaxID=36200 RepID=A0A7J5YTW6_DISMA|nr:hypothetical protein F7725_005262 [Dissostichus mawsoni]